MPQHRSMFAEKCHTYTASPVWKARANRYRREVSDHCAACGSAPVDVHHRTYVNAFAGLEPDQDLRPLCRIHHDLVHSLTTSRGGTMNLADATDTIINHRHRRRVWNYDPRTYDTWARSNGLAQAAPRRRKRRARDKAQRVLALLVWLLVCAAFFFAIVAVANQANGR